MGFEACVPSLHGQPIFPKQVGDLPAAVAAGDQQQSVQPIGPIGTHWPERFLAGWPGAGHRHPQ